MATNYLKINWENSDSVVLLNPRLSTNERDQLNILYKKYYKDGHIFVASSGTGQSQAETVKLYALSKEALLVSAFSVNQHLQVSSSDRWCCSIPSFHVGGLSIQVRASLGNNEVIDFADWNPQSFVQVLNNQKITLTSLVPTQVFDLVKAELSCPSSMRAVVVGGSAISEKLYLDARKLNWPLLPSFGMTEFCSQIATASLDSLQKNQFPELEILSHVDVKTNEQGNFLIKSKSMATGFAQIKNGVEIWQDLPTNEYYESADKGFVKNNTLLPAGRDGDFVKIRGEGVSLKELREQLAQLADELQTNCTIVARENERLGFELVLIAEDKISSERQSELKNLFNTKVRPFEKIETVISVSKIPKTDLGKIQFERLK